MVVITKNNTQEKNRFKPVYNLYYKPSTGIFKEYKEGECLNDSLASIEIIPIRYLYKLDNMYKQSTLCNNIFFDKLIIFEKGEEGFTSLGEFRYDKLNKGWINKKNEVEKLPIVLVIACLYKNETCYLQISGMTQRDLFENTDKKQIMLNKDKITLIACDNQVKVGKKGMQKPIYFLQPSGELGISEQEQEKSFEISNLIDLEIKSVGDKNDRTDGTE